MTETKTSGATSRVVIPPGFRESLVDPEDKTTLLVLIDWYLENDKPVHADAVRWIVRNDMVPQFITSRVHAVSVGLSSLDNSFVDTWNWYPSHFTSSDPATHRARAPAELYTGSLNWYAPGYATVADAYDAIVRAIVVMDAGPRAALLAHDWSKRDWTKRE